MAVDWFRSWHGAPTDAKWIVVARRAGEGVTPGHVAAVWWYLMDYASQNTPRGSLDGFDVEVCAASYGWDRDVVAGIVEALKSKYLIVENSLTHWPTRNPKREDDSVERVQRYRVTQRNAPVTHGNAVKRNVTLDESREEIEESRGDEITEKENPPIGGQKKEKSASALVATKRKGVSLPDGWLPTQKHREMARASGSDLDIETDRFRDWAIAKGQVYRDWDAAFRNWLRNARPGISAGSQASRITNEYPGKGRHGSNGFTQIGELSPDGSKYWNEERKRWVPV